ncbi:MAG: histidinol dehydrogenase [Gammaproteobacteria bacterium]|nr:histidinol dehydrogenase [Gammaproteobacteria bacterium]
MTNILKLNTTEPGFWDKLAARLAWDEGMDDSISASVREILHAVRARGDAALLDYTRRFDRLTASSVAALEIPKARLAQALNTLPAAQREALETAAARIRDYHSRQKIESWSYHDSEGALLGQQVTAIERAGLYVPGGKAAYPSSVLMNAIPAKVAGVTELIMTVPAPDSVLNELVLAAAMLSGVDRVFTIGGAQAIAALAYGTETIARVDKIVGPGNIYVATAKRMVYGAVGIDMVAGPSEILVLSDGSANPDWVAMDLFSQAEHDEDARAMLVSPDAAFLNQVDASIARLLPEMERAPTIRASLSARAAFIQVRDLDEAIVVANFIAPEHLELALDHPETLAPRIRNAGAIFLGHYTPEAIGDYCAGPNHVLPTSRTARYSSPLGVYDFQKRTSLIQCSAESAARLGKTASILARGEGLTAHARSAEYRITTEKREKRKEKSRPE